MGLKEKLWEEDEEISSVEFWKSIGENIRRISEIKWKKNICELTCLPSDIFSQWVHLFTLR